MFSNDFFKTLGQKRIQVLVGTATEYSDSTTYAAFLTEAAEGEIGFFNATTGALITGAIGSTTRFFAALKRDGRVLKTTPCLGSEVTKSKTAYSAPVKQVTDVYLGTRATLTVGNIVFTARQGGTGGNSITVTFDSPGNNSSLSVAVVGTAITVHLATDGASAPTSTGTQVLAALQASAAAMALVQVAGTGTMSTVQADAGSTALAGGAAGTAPTAGNEYGITIMDLTTATQPFPTYMYSYTAKTGDTLSTVITNLKNQINSTTSVANKDRDLIVDATSTAGELLTLTAKNYGTLFKVLITLKLSETATVNTIYSMKIGSGYYQQVKMLEEAGDIFAGVTTNYPENHATPEEFGKPASLVSSSNTYDMYMWTRIAQEASRTPHNVWNNLQYFTIACPTNGTNPTAEITTVLGL